MDYTAHNYIKSYCSTSDHNALHQIIIHKTTDHATYAKLRTKLCTTLKYYTQSYVPKLCNVP